MAENPDVLISNQKALVARLRSELLEAEGVLRGMEAIRNVLLGPFSNSRVPSSDTSPIANAQPRPEKTGYKGGRQPGAISSTWRKILSDLYWLARKEGIPVGIDVGTLVSVAQSNKVSIRPAEARKRMEHYMEVGYVAIEGGLFMVTEEAATKFGFKTAPLNLNGSNEPTESDRPTGGYDIFS